jgi:hypothetical protein
MTHKRPRAVIDLRRKKFGELTALKHAGRSKRRAVQWLCECSCGERIVVEGDRLRSGQKKTCGRNNHYPKKACRPQFRRAYRGEYRVWQAIKQRCLNTTNKLYKLYGRKGILIHLPWEKSFEQFITDLGARPSPRHVLRRLDTTANYVPGNVEWRIEGPAA